MQLNPHTFALIRQRLDEAERNIQYVRQALENPEAASEGAMTENGGEAPLAGERIVEGVFDGQNMQGNDGETYPVPPNYASKSKLVEGDILKLTIGADGSFVYKQIKPVDRRRAVGTLSADEQGNFGVTADGKMYRVLLASVTFYRAEEGDEVTILLPEHGEAEWGAVEHVIHQ
ncbi:MAG: hypothetical protein COT71_04100 [Candidatus Andersenbacteria bacterium CG10_big_fil_rev_8_21_14_0_10_54_11]|uniref:50S ribosomal protein L7/L12 n=1 Tax=Candidatus Andersenbacteria bacterium CG10_big_fil_rev_8_21_14_0_10_54_11 TaxID=1974485 RepID=A0A2M6WYI3_9BACT|nr:MAG: hypothetical protein COT71_04100 [Candidatus Andersenbacteria bacterium CG10_big_fil_rev_8_21_14_0_10_54_11]